MSQSDSPDGSAKSSRQPGRLRYRTSARPFRTLHWNPGPSAGQECPLREDSSDFRQGASGSLFGHKSGTSRLVSHTTRPQPAMKGFQYNRCLWKPTPRDEGVLLAWSSSCPMVLLERPYIIWQLLEIFSESKKCCATLSPSSTELGQIFGIFMLNLLSLHFGQVLRHT